MPSAFDCSNTARLYERTYLYVLKLAQYLYLYDMSCRYGYCFVLRQSITVLEQVQKDSINGWFRKGSRIGSVEQYLDLWTFPGQSPSVLDVFSLEGLARPRPFEVTPLHHLNLAPESASNHTTYCFVSSFRGIHQIATALRVLEV